MAHTEVAYPSFRFPGAQGFQMRAPVGEVVHLHEIEALDTQAPEGLLHLADALGAAVRPDFGGEEQLAGELGFSQQFAECGLGIAVHG